MIHSLVLQWLIAVLLRQKFERYFVQATQLDSYRPLLRAVNRTDCYPCVVLIDGWRLSVLMPHEAARLPILEDDV